MSARLPPLEFRRCLGAIETVSPWAVPLDYAVSAVNVDLSPDILMRPRCGTTPVSMTSGPTDDVFQLATIRTSGSDVLWVFSDWIIGTPSAHYKPTGAGWTSVTLTDTPAPSGGNEQVVAIAHNGKVFLAYNSSVNRLHVWDGASVRRVGLVAPAAPSVANQGAGTYAATVRYYKVQFVRYSAPTTIASSELSAATTFTPSGAGQSARITMPTNSDSAPYWRVWASSDNVTFYALTGLIDVGLATTYDDGTSPSTYNTLTPVAPEAGMFVPPPSARYLATNGERIFMAGSYEASASSGQTTPSTRRIWFTRPLGATDEGDDEAITQTELSRYWVDIESEDGAPITGLLSTLDGSVYAATATSLWRLSDTGLTDRPIALERVVSGVGPSAHYLMTSDDTVSGSMVYFASFDGPYRYSPSTGLQYLGADWVIRDAPVGNASAPRLAFCQFDPESRRIYYGLSDDTSSAYSKVRVLDPSLLRNMDGVWRGGWTLNSYAYASRLRCATIFENKIHIGGEMPNTAAALVFAHDTAESQDDGLDYVCTMITPDVVIGDGIRNVRTEEAHVWKRRNLSVSIVQTRNRGGTGNTVSAAAASESIGFGETAWHRVKVEGLVQADAYSLSLELGVVTPIINATTRHTDGVDRVVVPLFAQERG